MKASLASAGAGEHDPQRDAKQCGEPVGDRVAGGVAVAGIVQSGHLRGGEQGPRPAKWLRTCKPKSNPS